MKKMVNYFHIVLNLGKLTISELISLAYGIKTTGNTHLPHMPHSDGDLQAQALVVQNEIGSRASDPHPSLTKQEQQDVDKLSRWIVADTHYIQDAGNDLAQGERMVFDEFISDCGLTPKGPAKKHQRVAESLPAEAGSFHFRVPSEGKSNIVYNYEYGVVQSKGLIPETVEKPIPLSVTEVIVNGFTKDCWIAIHYTAIKHPKHTKATSANINLPDMDRAIHKVLTIHKLNTKGTVVITHQVAYMLFSDWIYIHVTGIQ